MGWWRDALFGMFIHWGVFSTVVAALLGGNPLPAVAAGEPGSTNLVVNGRFADAARGHPRVYLTADRLTAIKTNVAGDPNARKASQLVINRADALLAAKPIAYVRAGRRMLAPARETLSHVKHLGMAYHLTGESKYADAGIEALLAAARLPDWNPGHYLDTATLALAMGLGYDWFYHELTDPQKAQFVAAILEKGLRPSWGSRPWWLTSESNWNQVCNGGLGIAALAIWEAAPEIAAMTLERSLHGIPHTMKTYAPDGIYLEGPSYWSFGTTYAVMFIHALEDVMRTDHGLSDYPGFLQSMAAINFLTGPTGLFLNFSDGYRYRYAQAVSYWFAQRLQDPDLLFLENGLMGRALDRGRGADLVMSLIWTDGAAAARPPARLNWHGKGPQPMATFRSSWERHATFAGMKGGICGTGHGHMDVGSFVIDADGVRWASDAPSQRYDLEENARRKAKAEGRTFEPAFYRERWSHNILLVNGQKPVVGSRSPMVSVSEQPDGPHVMFDLSPSYEGQLARARRGMRLCPDNSVIVQDEFTTLPGEPAHVRWAMLTKNSPELTPAGVSPDGRHLVLTQGRKQASPDKRPASLSMHILEPAGARFEVVVVNEQPYMHDYDRVSDDARQVLIHLDVPGRTNATVVVAFRPGSLPADAPMSGVIPLDGWKAPGVD